MIARLLRWIAARKRDSYRRWLRRHVPNIPAKDTGYRTQQDIASEGNQQYAEVLQAARLGGNSPQAWRGKDGK